MAWTKSQSHYDVVIVGAGIWGLCAAHTFLKIEPSLNLLILDNKASVGGVWAKEQLYPYLRANNLQGYYEFTDFPILDAGLQEMGVQERGILSGEALHAYIYRYAEHFDLLKRTRLNTKVLRAVHGESDDAVPWTLKVASTKTDEEHAKLEANESVITCDKLIIATGQASKPVAPSIPGMDTFKKPVIHTVQLATEGKRILSDDTVQHITILGGSKSAHDSVYMFAKAGKKITWITRRSGSGGTPMAKSHTQMGPWKVWLEGLLMTRPLSLFGACPWGDADGFGWARTFLHKTAIGQGLVRGYFANMSGSSLEQSGIMDNEKTKTLVPDETLMWYGTQANSLNYDTDFYTLLKDNDVRIVREDIKLLDEDGIILQDGQRLETDVLICATGYDYSLTFPLEPAANQLAWGMPIEPSRDSLFPSLDAKADKELLARFPILSTSPSHLERMPQNLTPWRLWRFIAPPSQVRLGQPAARRDLAFLSAIQCYQNTLKAELTSLWTYAYFAHALAVDYSQASSSPASDEQNEQAVFYEAALWSRFGKWSRPMGMQGKIADFLHDNMPYYDLLLRDLGLRSWRKGWGLLGELFGGWYEVKDYKGIVEEWVEKHGEKVGGIARN